MRSMSWLPNWTLNQCALAKLAIGTPSLKNSRASKASVALRELSPSAHLRESTTTWFPPPALLFSAVDALAACRDLDGYPGVNGRTWRVGRNPPRFKNARRLTPLFRSLRHVR